jgi:CheY-like chemotaxis protein
VRVLVVDDHRNTRESLALGFARLGHMADVASSGAEAVGCLQERTYAWMVCDVRMPGMSGIELAATARQRQPHLVLVLMTAYDVGEDERRIINSLGVRLVIKPATAARLATLCERTDASLAQEETRT